MLSLGPTRRKEESMSFKEEFSRIAMLPYTLKVLDLARQLAIEDASMIGGYCRDFDEVVRQLGDWCHRWRFSNSDLIKEMAYEEYAETFIAERKKFADDNSEGVIFPEQLPENQGAPFQFVALRLDGGWPYSDSAGAEYEAYCWGTVADIAGQPAIRSVVREWRSSL